MKLLTILAATCALATPALAGVKETLDRHILPGFDHFAEATGEFSTQAGENCLPASLRPAYQATYDAWMPVADLRLGPSETGALSVAFWPDSRGFTGRTLNRLIAEQDPVAQNAEAYAEVSIAARGLLALERLLFDPDFADYTQGSYTCTLVTTIAADLDAQAKALAGAWRDSYADTLRSAGQPGNSTYLTENEALRALYTQILSSLEFTANQRLGRPMGSFERPRPARAEARRSARSLRNVVLAAEAAHGLATALADWDLPETDAAMADLHEAASHISDPAFQDVTDPQARLRAEVLQQAVHSLNEAIQIEIGARLGITPGFNSQDGD